MILVRITIMVVVSEERLVRHPRTTAVVMPQGRPVMRTPGLM